MNRPLLDKLVNALLYEGYLLYPYRSSSVKNQRERFTFGRVYPCAYSEAANGAEPCLMQTECLFQTGPKGPAELEVWGRFLQPMARQVAVPAIAGEQWKSGQPPALRLVQELEVNGEVYRSWQEAIEREIKLPALRLNLDGRDEHRLPFQFPASEALEPIRDGQDCIVAALVRRTEKIEGEFHILTEPVDSHLAKVTVRIVNLSALEELQWKDSAAVISCTFASTHMILHGHGGLFISLLDPPAEFKEAAAACKNIGTWPVLVGCEEEGERDTVLSSPIILYDYPKVAAESHGDLFDGTEIDEILSLRILTMTDAEKREMRQVDVRARQLLERTEGLTPEDWLDLHGARRESRSFDEQLFGTNGCLTGAELSATGFKCGQRVRIRPKARADVMDIALAGRIAVIEAVEQDAEQRIHLALVLEDDPGKDLGMLRQTGHRFFYGLDEVEPVLESETEGAKP